MTIPNLSDKQQKVLDIILSSIQSNGVPPSIREIKDASGIKSLRGVTLQLESLDELGLIQRESGARSIKINPALLDFNEEKVDVKLAKSNSEVDKVSVPMMMSPISAGYGNFAEDYSDEEISLSLIDTKGLRSVVAIKISGDSMINEGIEDGDIAVIYPQPTASDGDIVAATTENGVTLKKYRIVEGVPMLMPANPKYRPITEQFSIQGKLINILKNED